MFRSLDFIYSPSRNAKEELHFCAEILGGEAVFSIKAFDTRVAAVRFGEGPYEHPLRRQVRSLGGIFH